MRETDKNNLPIPVCFFFQLESHGRPQTVCLTYHMFKDVFVWHPFWKVSEFLDRLMEKTLGSKTGQTTKYSSENKKKHVPWKSMVSKHVFSFPIEKVPFLGEQETFVCFLCGDVYLEAWSSYKKPVGKVRNWWVGRWRHSPSGWCCWRGDDFPPWWVSKINPKLQELLLNVHDFVKKFFGSCVMLPFKSLFPRFFIYIYIFSYAYMYSTCDISM